MQNKGLLGGLLLLLPQRSHESGGGEGDDSDENVGKALVELEQWLVHNTFQVCVLKSSASVAELSSSGFILESNSVHLHLGVLTVSLFILGLCHLWAFVIASRIDG